jgi:hypothetical protein
MDSATMATLLKATADAKRSLDAAADRSTVDDIKGGVDAVGMQLAENVLTEVRSGFDHLAVAIEAGDDDIPRDELGHARQYFHRLANRPGGGTVSGTSGSLTGEQVCALGYLGNSLPGSTKTRAIPRVLPGVAGMHRLIASPRMSAGGGCVLRRRAVPHRRWLEGQVTPDGTTQPQPFSSWLELLQLLEPPAEQSAKEPWG